MRPTALLVSLSLLSAVPPASAQVFSAEVGSPQLAGFVQDVEKLGYKIRFVVPATTKTTQVCVPCLTTETGHTVCADPLGPPEAPFCHQETETLSVQVVYEKAPADQPCVPSP